MNNLEHELSKRGYVVVETSVPDTAYKPSVLCFEKADQTHRSIRIIIEKRWWDDGENWQDNLVRLLVDEVPIREVDLDELLRRKLTVPLRQHTLKLLLDSIDAMEI